MPKVIGAGGAPPRVGRTNSDGELPVTVEVAVIPAAGRIADARDTAAALRDVWSGKESAGSNLLAAGIRWVPIVGDGIKAGMRVGRQAIKEGAGEIVGQVMTSTGHNAVEGTLRKS